MVWRVARIIAVLVVFVVAAAGCAGSTSSGGNTGNIAAGNSGNTATSTLTVTSTTTETAPPSTSSTTTTGSNGGTGNTGPGGSTSNTGAGNGGGGVEGPGSYSHVGDSEFCSTHQCITNFPNGRGDVVQCNDGEWSHSGGLAGACSDHGGEGSVANTGTTGNTGLTPGDQNPNDASGANCDATMEIGPHSDCYVAQQTASDLAKGVWSAPGSDTVTEGSNIITFSCSITGNAGGASQAPVYTCTSTQDSQDWFKFEFT